MMPLPQCGVERDHEDMLNLCEKAVLVLRSSQIDADLAVGASPEISSLHMRRACRLVAPNTREMLSASWERVLADLDRPVRGISGRVPVCRAAVRDAETAIRELIAALRTDGPMPARGVAMIVLLMTDGNGPLYRRTRPHELAQRIAQAIPYLDPESSLHDLPDHWEAGLR
jgi:hypothetical protein